MRVDGAVEEAVIYADDTDAGSADDNRGDDKLALAGRGLELRGSALAEDGSALLGGESDNALVILDA